MPIEHELVPEDPKEPEGPNESMSGWEKTVGASEVIGFAASIVGGRDTAQKLARINHLLKKALRFQGDIVHAIADLKVYFAQALENEFREEAHRALQTAIDKFNIVMTKANKDADPAEVCGDYNEDLRKDVLESAWDASIKMPKYGAAAYQAASSAMFFMVGVFRAFRIDKKTQKGFFLTYLETFQMWISDPTEGVDSRIAWAEQGRAADDRQYTEFSTHPLARTPKYQSYIAAYLQATKDWDEMIPKLKRIRSDIEMLAAKAGALAKEVG